MALTTDKLRVFDVELDDELYDEVVVRFTTKGDKKKAVVVDNKGQIIIYKDVSNEADRTIRAYKKLLKPKEF